jgi:hypothetical protein
MDLQINIETRANELEREVLKLQARVKELEKALSGRYRFLENEKLKIENERILKWYKNTVDILLTIEGVLNKGEFIDINKYKEIKEYRLSLQDKDTPFLYGDEAKKLKQENEKLWSALRVISLELDLSNKSMDTYTKRAAKAFERSKQAFANLIIQLVNAGVVDKEEVKQVIEGVSENGE